MNLVSVGLSLVRFGLSGLQVVTRAPYDPHDDPGIMRDLLDVGPRKPLGYLPLTTLRRHGYEPRAFRRAATVSGLTTRLFVRDSYVMLPPYRGRRRFPLAVQREHAHLYVWHEPALQAMLDAHRDVLRDNRWPMKASAFVRKVSRVSADEPRLYRLIGRAFADKREL